MNALAWIATGAGAAAATFVAAEWITRAWLARRGRPYVWVPYSHLRMHLDPETLADVGPVAEHRINSEGERGDPLPADRADTYRILVAGGSAAECWFLDQEDSWPQVLQRELEKPERLRALGTRHVHVGNVARSLITARQVDALLERILPHYPKLDAIVFMVGASDIITWLESGAPAQVPEPPVPSATLFAQHPDPPFGWTPKTLALRRVASYWRTRLTDRIVVREGAGKRLGEARRMRQRAREIVNEMPDPSGMLAGFERWFARLLERAKAKAPLVVVVRQPWLEKDLTPEEQARMWSFATARPYAGEVTRYYAHEVGWRLHRLVDARAAEIARAAGVVQVDLMPLVPADLAHYYDDHHHTPLGNHVIGRIVADALVAARTGVRASNADGASTRPSPRGPADPARSR